MKIYIHADLEDGNGDIETSEIYLEEGSNYNFVEIHIGNDFYEVYLDELVPAVEAFLRYRTINMERDNLYPH